MGWLGIGYGFGGGHLNRTLHTVAQHFRGRVQGGFFSQQTAEFHNEGRVVCEFVSHQGRWWFEVRFKKVDLPTTGRMVSLLHKRAQVPVVAGFAYFTRFRDGDGHEHVLYHQSARDGYQLLSDGVRQQMGILRQMPFGSPVEVLLLEDMLVVRKAWSSVSPESAVRFVHQALTFRDQLLLIGTGAIAFVDNPAPVNIEHAKCQVCGEMIAQEDIVLCSRCRTPHHHDCWSYGEGCSVYGCGGKEPLPLKVHS